jgi:fibronectin-binding autotransporter adhesin
MLRKTFWTRSGVGFLAVMLIAGSIKAATITWDADFGDWTASSYWDLNRLPTSSDTAFIINDGVSTILQNGAVCDMLYAGNSGVGHSGTIQMDGGSLSARYEYIGNTGTGTFNQTAGTNTVSQLYLGYGAGANGNYNLSGTGMLTASEIVGFSGTGVFYQSGGNNIHTGLYLGYNSGSSGTYILSETGCLGSGYTEDIGVYGVGTITQTGGTNSLTNGTLRLGVEVGSLGTYNLSGTGSLICNNQYIGVYGTANFNHSAGVNTIASPNSALYIGACSGAKGTYNLSDTGRLDAHYVYVGVSGEGIFNQTGGINTITTSSYSPGLYLGRDAGSSGTYNLSGAGQLSAVYEYIGYHAAASALFQQNGGTNSATIEYIGYNDTVAARYCQGDGNNIATYITIGKNSQYLFSGGFLQINAGFDNQGIFDFAGGSATMTVADSIVNLARPGAALRNTENATLNVSSNSLLIVPGDFDPTTKFLHFSNAGILHTAGSPLTISEDRAISGWANIDDHVTCQGSLTATSGGAIYLNSGITISGSGKIDLGNGNLKVEDASSSLSGGSLTAFNQYIGYSGEGAFIQSAGFNTVTANITTSNVGFFLGYNAQAKGTYTLTGSGQLKANSEYVGYNGTGTFNQSAGTNTCSYLVLGQNAGSLGSYNLDGTGSVTNYDEIVGWIGEGIFTQSSGSATSSGGLTIGYQKGSKGTYNLSGGSLTLGIEYVGRYGEGTFNHSGGINNIPENELNLGYEQGSQGIYNLSGSGTLIAGLIRVGSSYGSTGIFNQSAGSISANAIQLGSKGVYNLTGGILATKGIYYFENPTFNFGGGTIKASSTLSTSIPMVLTGINGNANIDTAGNAVTFSGPLSGSGGLNKLGTGTLTLSAANHYSGPTTITAGTLSLTGSLNSNSSLAISNGAFSYAPTANGGTGNAQELAGLTVHCGISAVSVSVGNTLGLGVIARDIGGIVNFNNSAGGTITTTQANVNDILGPWATYGSGTSMTYAAASIGSSPSKVTPYTGATMVTSGLDGFNDTSGMVNYAVSSGGGTLTANISANTVQFTGATNTITVPDANSISLNGVMNVGSEAAMLTGGNLVIGSTKELVFIGPGNITVESAIQDNAGGGSAIVMGGRGMLALSGANGYSGGTYLLDGTLCLNNPTALGRGGLTIYGGALDNTSPGAVRLSNDNPQAWNCNISFVGTHDLDLGIGPVVLGGNTTVTAKAHTLTVGGVISGPYCLTKAGAGTLSLSGANIYSGGTTLSAGTLNLNNTNALGAGIFTIAGTSTIDNTTAGPLSLSTNNPQLWNADFTFAGTQSLNLGAGPITFSANRTVTVNARTLAVDGPIIGNHTLYKKGPGTLSLLGSVNNGGVSVTVNSGTLFLKKDDANPDVSGTLGNVSIASGVFDSNGLTESMGWLVVGSGGATNTSGYARLSNGTLTATATPYDGYVIGAGNSGVLDQTGGTLNAFSGMSVGSGNGFGAFNVSGGTVNINLSNTGSTLNLGPSTATGVVTVKGSGRLTATATNVTMGMYSTGSTSIINLGGIGSGGGLLNTASIFNNGATGMVNFHGGTLQANTDTGTDIGWYNGGHNTGFLTGTSNYVYGEGAVIDTNGHDIIISTPLLAPTGKGVTNIAVTAGGSGYIGAPAVKINFGGGKGATAFATIDANGTVTGIVITNPGVGYMVTPTVTLVGGGGSGATLGAITTSANFSGGLSKLGDGTLTLAGANTYTGDTIVSAGMLKFANTSGSATGSGSVMINAGATLSGTGTISGPVTIGGTLAPGNSPGILTVNNKVTLQPSAIFNAEVFGLAAGTGYDALTTTGPVSLAGSLSLSFGNFTPTGNDVLFLVNNTGTSDTTGTFQYVDDAKLGTFNGFDWYITYHADNASSPRLDGGNDVAIYSVAVPEPATLVELTVGLSGLAAFALRRRLSNKVS